jgi:hypothetical protein
MASLSYLSVSSSVYDVLSEIFTNGKLATIDTSNALVTFHISMSAPTKDEISTTVDVSLSYRYRKMTTCEKALRTTLLAESPFMLLLSFQKPMSDLKASTSRTECSIDTATVSPKKYGFPSRNILLTSSLSPPELMPHCSWRHRERTT